MKKVLSYKSDYSIKSTKDGPVHYVHGAWITFEGEEEKYYKQRDINEMLEKT